MLDKKSKERIRKEIWSVMEEKGVTRFPRPVEGRIPNFEGAEKAAEGLAKLKIFREASFIKANPDSPQHPVRRKAIENGKVLYMPTPRLRKGFLRIDPVDVPPGDEGRAATIKHSADFGEKVNLSRMVGVDLVVAGSVAVTRDGGRIGKGGGYSDLEYAILRELGLGEPPVVTTVHSLQLVEEIPMKEHDVPLDWVVTPGEVIETNSRMEKPGGIDWSMLDEGSLKKMPVLQRLRNKI